MTCWLAALLVFAAQPPAEVELAGVRVSVSVHAHVYEWTITNVSAEPIMSFEVEQSNCYNHLGPDGWTTVKEGRLIRSWTTERALAIRPGQSGSVTAQVSSRGAVLGTVYAKVGFGDQVAPVILEIWGPVRMPYASLLTVPGTIVVIALFHALVFARRKRQPA